MFSDIELSVFSVNFDPHNQNNFQNAQQNNYIPINLMLNFNLNKEKYEIITYSNLFRAFSCKILYFRKTSTTLRDYSKALAVWIFMPLIPK